MVRGKKKKKNTACFHFEREESFLSIIAIDHEEN